MIKMMKKNRRHLEITKKQRIFIAGLEDFGFPRFTGKTRGEAYDYLQRYAAEYRAIFNDGPEEIDRWQADGGYF